MYRFLIIDDEPVVREGISETIDWKNHGFELVGACRDGREALDALDELKPDVVLTDICMPFVDGLELAGWIGEQYPRTKVILLTGYDEFEYAQEAVKLKVSDFILKPITADELRTLLDSVKRDLDEERLQQRRLDRLHEQLKESLPVLKERFLNRLARGPLTEAEIMRKMTLLGLDLPGPSFAAFMCDTDSRDQNDQDDFGVLAVQGIVSAVAESVGQTVAFSTPQDQVIVLVSADTHDTARLQALDLAEAISEQVERDLGQTVSVGVGNPVTALTQVPQSVKEAKTALEHRLVLGPNHIVTVDQVRGATEETALSLDSDSRARFAAALRSGFPKQAQTELQTMVQEMRSLCSTRQTCYVEMNRLLADTLNAMETLGVNYSVVEQLGHNPFEQLAAHKTLEDMEAWFLRLLEEVRRELEGRRREHSRWKAVEAEEHIRATYMSPDLSLKSVCNALSVSKSYLSSVFKAHTGMTFVEYLTAVRMEHAKELLASDDLRSYEVAERVGFRDAHYFSLTFKKQVGMSPTEFRDLARETDDAS